MPESKHRRKGRSRPRAYETAPPKKNPTPSPPWVPATGAGLLVGGVVVILLGYLPPVNDAISALPPLYGNWGLVVGFVMLAVGFGFLTRWQ
jgi:hypothetical protein